MSKGTAKAIFWSFADKGGQQLFSLLFGIAMGRLLLPEQFGQIGLLFVFTAIANILQDGALSAGLIRKQAPTQADYSTALWTNLSISLLLYGILFFTAPVISAFYNQPTLTPIARILFLSFVFNALGLVQYTRLIKAMNFKTNALIGFISILLSGTTAVYMAWQGYGAVSLAMQVVLLALFKTLFLWMAGQWKPTFVFQIESLKEILPYSAKLMMSNLLNQLCAGIYPNVIGKQFSILQTGFYTQAVKWQAITMDTIANGFSQVCFPLFSQKSTQLPQLHRTLGRMIRMTAFVSFPAMLLLAVVAEPLLITLLGDNWKESGKLLQLLAMVGLFYPLTMVHLSMIKALGKSGTILQIEIGRNILSVLSLLCLIRTDLSIVIIGLAVVNWIYFIVSSLSMVRYARYPLMRLCKDLFPYLAIAFLLGTPLYCWQPNYSPLVLLLLKSSIFITGYILITYRLGSVILKDIVLLAKNKML